MKLETIAPPAADEHAPYYAGYVGIAREAGVLPLLQGQPARLRSACARLDEEQALARYAPGKWSIKEVIGHLADSERIFAYRVLRISRGDPTPLASFDENAYVAAAGFDARPLSALLDEFDAVRSATMSLIGALEAPALERRGTASGMEISVRALLFVIAGHAEHHLGLLSERYGIRAAP